MQYSFGLNLTHLLLDQYLKIKMSTDKPLLDHFWRLISDNESQRISAAFKIVTYLQHKVRNIYILQVFWLGNQQASF